ncbi:MAG: DNA-binding protein Alba [Thermoprotei archaeon]|nr:DNA-binding protein Alba [Thermoprotei archaeon]
MSESTNNVVFVGKKAIMNYVLACVTMFHQGAKRVIIKARGKAINKAVEVARVVRENFIRGAMIENVNIGTEILTSKDGNTYSISTITIILRKEG